ncbi:MAG: electron transfer flavoprotein subunit alpha/FixB family protein [Acidobacteria bacterium]|nr:electron transfer flavoprotein subunit alpha/FixB family protein [Acidobacteriota bacterium]
MANGFLVFIESRNGKIRKSSLETLTQARHLAGELGTTVDAVVFGPPEATDPLKAYGPRRIFQVSTEPDVLSRDNWIAFLEGLVRREEPAYVLAAATATGKDLLPGVAARFARSVVQDVTEITVDGGTMLIKRPIYAGKAFQTVKLTGTPGFVSLRPNVFPAEPGDGAAEVVPMPETVDVGALRSRIREVRESQAGKVELTEAAIIVSGGRGIKEAENYTLIEQLADAAGAAAGASRAIVDAGWVDHQQQVGQTGKTVSPTLYIAVGISGAIQHLAGMSSSKYIVAINKDPDAPIFKVADYGIVGDLFKVVPLLTEEFRKIRNQ